MPQAPSSTTIARRATEAWRWALIVFLLADLAYSFFQHYHATLDGDMAAIILPAPHYAQVLRDPLGLQALLEGAYYGGSNRFIPHWTMRGVYTLVPRALQTFASPLDSVYLAGALAKTAMQAALLYLLSAYASGATSVFNRRFLLAAVLLTPLFQTYGLAWHVGIVSGSPTYSFFYAASSAWLLAMFLPHFFWYVHGRNLARSPFAIWLGIPLAWAVSFNGPLNSAVLLLVCPAILAYEMIRAKSTREPGPGAIREPVSERPRWILYATIAGLVFAIWSYAVGRYNIENLEQSLPLLQRYALLPEGLRYFFFASPAVLILTDALLANLALVNILRLSSARRINRLALAFALFATVYTLLLPMGGYRPYRPLIIRCDSVQPVILGALVFYALSGVELLRSFNWKRGLFYSIVPLILTTYFMYCDEPSRGNNYCEREAIKAIAASPDKVVGVDASCTIMAWERLKKPEESRQAGLLLFRWRIFPEPKKFYQPPADTRPPQ